MAQVKFFLQTWMIYWQTAALHVVCAAMWAHVTSASVSPPLDGTELIANPVVYSGMLKKVLVSHLMICLSFHLISHTKIQVELYINTRHLYFCRSYDPLSPKTSNSLYLHFVLLTYSNCLHTTCSVFTSQFKHHRSNPNLAPWHILRNKAFKQLSSFQKLLTF